MSIIVKNGILQVPGAQEKLRHKGQEKPEFLTDYTLIDIETTGLSPYRDRVTELGGIKVRNGEIVDEYSHLVAYDKSNKVPAFITKLNGITEEKILNEGIPVDEASHDFREFIGDDVIIGYNVNFDLNFVYDLAKKYHLPELNNDYVDVLRLARAYYPRERHNRLIDCMQRAGIAQVEQHRGLDDSIDTKKVYDDFRQHFTPELLAKAQSKVKNLDLTAEKLNPWELSFYNPISNKQIVLSGNLHLDQTDAAKMIQNMGGKVADRVSAETNYLVMGDHDFFRRDNADLELARQLIKQGAKISRLSETFFLNMLDDWARS
ncbi:MULTISPECIES: exonuclease domain-containing protein [Lactobacillus]|uniref:DNA polymerase III polC-type n=1 Tax=Lactobacillus xujianguonis TaxID=2495899 RepID=A0A437STB9_9LACO|nr:MULTISPECIES: exonuclease domain-containing protein [Lactobacillus]RVU70145.1 3'-5' exonuclease [Lactobacillus xujianguonis]RVU73363.1 3'-5' exonuclease [Lactobacillus xujianguonis]